MSRPSCFAAGLLTAYLVGAAAAIAGLWVWDAGRWRKPVHDWIEEHRHVT